MIFVFLQFMPPEPKDFGVQLEVVLVCWVFLAIVLKLYPYLQRGKKQAKPTVQTLHTGLKQLSQILTRIADGETDDDFSKELYKLEDTYHRMAYQMQTVFQKATTAKNALICWQSCSSGVSILFGTKLGSRTKSSKTLCPV